MSDATTKAAPRLSDVRWPGEIVIEFADLKNRCFIWPPLQDKVRGRWSKSNVPYTQVSEQIAQVPDLPGQRVRLDCRRRRAEVYDPMRADELEHELKQFQGVLTEMFRRNEGPADAIVRENLTDSDMKLWLYWMRRFVDGSEYVFGDRRDRKKKTDGGPQAAIVSGDLPAMEQIALLPGKIRTDAFNSAVPASAPRYREDA